VRTRVLVVAALAGAACLGAACSGGGGGSASGDGVGGLSANASTTRATCTLLERLPHAADALTKVPLNDPQRFEAAMNAAVADYTRTLDDIAPRVPAKLRREVEVLRSAVQQRKFADAQAARAPLDDWAADHCS
jgi:hypothetical protein